MRILKCRDLNRSRTLQENFKQEFKPKVDILQEKLHQGDCKQLNGPKMWVSTRPELECEK